ncbi:hypothetical protein L6V77_06145 [Myxococcota bacterium]|nr:hypothetical protein [Myxococcota bacterium]
MDTSPAALTELSLSAAPRTAWIFGAGASRCAPYNVPTQFSLMARFSTQPVAGATPALRQHFRDVRGRLPGWIAQVQPGRVWTDWQVSLEEVFSHYELVATQPRLHTPTQVAEARQALDDLTFALRAATAVFGGNNALKFRPFERPAGTAAPYAELVEHLLTDAGAHPPRNYAAGRHTFVTMNYDILLDRCLLHLDSRGLGVGLDYGFPLDNGRARRGADMAADGDAHFTLLRVHGSLNWARCLNCGAVFSTWAKHAQTGPGEVCAVCEAESLASIMVHPSYTRVYDDPVIARVWAGTRRALAGADRWVIIGYSLPAADVHFRALLREARARRRAQGLATEVVLVGRRPAPEENQAAPDEFERAVSEYRALFADDLRVWDATPRGFGDFVRALRP